MKYIYIILIVAVIAVLGATVIFTRPNTIKENTMTEKTFYETADPFFYQDYNGKTYGQIANSIIGDLVDLKKDLPQLTEISEDARYNLNKSGDVFRVVFEYNNKDTGRIDWSVEMTEYKPNTLPEGKIPLTLDMVPDYTFIGKIGGAVVTFDFKNGDGKIKDKIIDILKNNGAVEQNKDILLPLAQ